MLSPFPHSSSHFLLSQKGSFLQFQIILILIASGVLKKKKKNPEKQDCSSLRLLGLSDNPFKFYN